jgi:uncharacterized Rossmann fold enzyme
VSTLQYSYDIEKKEVLFRKIRKNKFNYAELLVNFVADNSKTEIKGIK